MLNSPGHPATVAAFTSTNSRPIQLHNQCAVDFTTVRGQPSKQNSTPFCRGFSERQCNVSAFITIIYSVQIDCCGMLLADTSRFVER